MNDYQNFEHQVVAILERENTGSILRIEIDHHTMTGTAPGKLAIDLEKEYQGFKFDEYEVRVK